MEVSLKGQQVLRCWRKILASFTVNTVENCAHTLQKKILLFLNCTYVNDIPTHCTHITVIRQNFIAMFQVHFKCILPMPIPCMLCSEGYQTYLSFRAYVIGFLHVLLPRLELTFDMHC